MLLSSAKFNISQTAAKLLCVHKVFEKKKTKKVVVPAF